MAYARVTAPRLLLGLMLERCRKKAGIPQPQAAEAIGQSKTTISNLEAGQATCNQESLEKLASLYKVSDDDRKTILALGAQSRGRASQQSQYADRLPEAFQRFADIERFAENILTYEPLLVPGLLQTDDYMTALLQLDSPEPDVLESRIQFRRERQQEFWASKKPLHAVIGETAFHAVVGNPDIMKGQIDSLIGMAYMHPQVTLQVIPFTAADIQQTDRFTLFQFAGKAPAMGNAAVPFGPPVYYDDEEIITEIDEAFHKLSNNALTADETKEFLTKLHNEGKEAIR